MTDFLDSFLAQINNQTSGMPPAQAMPIRTQDFPITPSPDDIFRVNQSMSGMAQQAITPPTATMAPASMIGQAIGPPAPNPSMIGQSPRVNLPKAALAPAAAPAVGAAAAAPVSTTAGTAAGAVASTADDAVASGLGSRIRSAFPSMAGANVSKGSLLKGGAAAVAGMMASGWIDARNFGGENSELDQALTGGLLGGGLAGGAAMALGLGAGPVGWAVLGGAALFAAGNMVFGDNDSTQEKMEKAIATANGTIDDLIANPIFGIDPDTASQIKLQVAATTEFYKNSGDVAGLNAYLAGLSQTVPSFLMEATARNSAQQQKMQLQAAYGPVYSRMVDRSSNAAKQAFEIQMQAAGAVSDPTIQAAMKSQAAQQYSAQMDTMTAYAQQIAAAPQASTPAAQGVLDQTQALMQQYMGG